MKFYPQDWRADEQLRLCSLSARGLWIEMLAIMHRSERYGQLLISGRVPTDAQLAVQVGASPEQVAELIDELAEAGVFSRAAGGAIYSRRMTRDHRKAETARKNGKNGGNPNLRKLSGILPLDNPPDKAPLKPQKPEARGSVSNETGSADPVKTLFDIGVDLLTKAGRTEKEARTMVGLWRSRKGDPELAALLIQARSKSDPLPWIQKAIGLERSPADDLQTLLSQSARYRKQAA
jgi:hypothetical protein